MKTKDKGLRTKDHAGFTLIELLVVIAIIGTLVALLMSGVMAAIARGEELKNSNDINQMEMALQAFFTEYGFYPPSRFNPNAPGQLGIDSRMYLKRMFPRFQSPPAPPTPPGFPVAGLVGDQCLVFFLGGPRILPTGPPVFAGGFQVGYACNGFSTNPANPWLTTGSRTPAYDFKPSRLANVRGNGYPSYLDIYFKSAAPKPYAYFSAYNTRNGYNSPATPKPGYPGSDCPGAFGPTSGPFYDRATTPVNFLKPDTFQIMSAGRNGLFGGQIAPWAQNTPGSVDAGARDNQANFSKGKLGS